MFFPPIRNFILGPVREAGIDPPFNSDPALSDAISVYSERGIVIPLANHHTEPQKAVTLRGRLRLGKDPLR